MTKIQVNFQGKAYLTTAGKALVSTQPTLVTKSITENGTYNASSDNADGYSSVTVNVSGGGSSSKYGCTIDNLLGNVDANGVLQLPTAPSGDIVFSGIKDIVSKGLYYRFYALSDITGTVSFPDLENLTTLECCLSSFQNTKTSSISFPKLKTISGSDAMRNMFNGTNVINVEFPELTTVSSINGFRQVFQNCYLLETLLLPKLQTVSGSYGMSHLLYNTNVSILSFPNLSDLSGSYALNLMLQNCPRISSISFPSLTTSSFGSYTNQFNNIFSSTSGSTSRAITMHFPSNISSTISGLTGYPNFGASSGRLTLAFDLPATT